MGEYEYSLEYELLFAINTLFFHRCNNKTLDFKHFVLYFKSKIIMIFSPSEGIKQYCTRCICLNIGL